MEHKVHEGRRGHKVNEEHDVDGKSRTEVEMSTTWKCTECLSSSSFQVALWRTDNTMRSLLPAAESTSL